MRPCGGGNEDQSAGCRQGCASLYSQFSMTDVCSSQNTMSPFAAIALTTRMGSGQPIALASFTAWNGDPSANFSAIWSEKRAYPVFSGIALCRMWINSRWLRSIGRSASGEVLVASAQALPVQRDAGNGERWQVGGTTLRKSDAMTTQDSPIRGRPIPILPFDSPST